MDIYSYAMQMERDGEQFYRDIAARTDNPGIRNILNMLAEAEVRHYEMFNRMKTHEPLPIADLGYLSRIKNVFARMREGKETVAKDGAQVELYRKAQDLEKKTRDFYQEQASQVSPDQREVFQKIAKEEQKHYDVLEHLIIMLHRPETWLENAEWYRLEEY